MLMLSYGMKVNGLQVPRGTRQEKPRESVNTEPNVAKIGTPLPASEYVQPSLREDSHRRENSASVHVFFVLSVGPRHRKSDYYRNKFSAAPSENGCDASQQL